MNCVDKVCVVMVTYGDRSGFFTQVLDVLLEVDCVENIIIVSNNSSKKSINVLSKFEKNFKTKIEIIYLLENTGSAGGFKRGIQAAFEKTICDFIWLLDDDNRPEISALNVILEFWKQVDLVDKEKKISLLSSREDMPQFKEAVYRNIPNLEPGRSNIFRAFHFADFFVKFLGRIKLFRSKTCNLNRTNGEIYVAPYGGMFFHRNLIDVIGLPDERFYLYCDDYDFSYRIRKNGGRIFCLLESRIYDVSRPWHLQKSLKAPFRFALHKDYIRQYYVIRNRVYFERQNLVNNKFVYFINLFVIAHFSRV